MIVFCEECGQKNALDHPCQPDGHIFFTCQKCSFQNRYTLRTNSASTATSAFDIERIQKTSGVIGTVLWDAEKGLKFHNMPQPLSAVDIGYIAQKIWECYQEADNAQLKDIQEMTYFIEQRHLFTKRKNNTLLIICCQSQDTALYFADHAEHIRI